MAMNEGLSGVTGRFEYKRSSEPYDHTLAERGFRAEEIYALDLAHIRIFSKLKGRISVLTFGDVLDIGAGRDILRQSATGAVRSWVSLDYDLRAPTIDVQGDAHNLPFPDTNFDCVVCADVLEHLRDPERAMEEMRRVLRPKGIAIVSVPFFLNLHEAPFDFVRYSKYGLEALFRRHGFEVIEIERTCGFVGTLGYWLVAALTKVFKFSRFALRVVLSINRLFQLTLLSWIDNRFDKKGRFSQGHIGVFRKI